MKLERCSRFGDGGGVSLFLGFPAFPLRLASVRYLVQGLRFHLNPFFVQAFDNLLRIEAALLHPLQRWGKGKNGLLHGHGAVSVQRDGGGFEFGKLLSDFFQLLAVMVMMFSPVLGGERPRFVFCLWRSSGTLAHWFTQ